MTHPEPDFPEGTPGESSEENSLAESLVTTDDRDAVQTDSPLEGGTSDEWLELQPTSSECVITCTLGGESHEHIYPGDWIFGGADGTHPASDPRYKPTTYTYRDEELDHIYVTQTPLCEEQALDEFTWVRNTFPGSNPVYLEITLPGEVPKFARWRYNSTNDTLSPIKKGV